MSDQRRARIALGLGFVSALQLGLELLFIKLSRYEFGGFSLGVIGVAMLGVALAGPLTAVLGGPAKASARATHALAPTALLAGLVMFSLEHHYTAPGATLVRMAVCGLACLVPLALSAVPVFASMRRQLSSVHGYYAASLAGATAGAPLAFGLMALVGDLGAYAAILALALPAVLLLGEPGRARGLGLGAAAVAILAALLVLPRLDRAAHPDADFVRTNAFSRIDAFHRDGGRIRFDTAGINAGTSTPGGTVANPPRGLLEDLAARAYASRPRRVLVLGAGGGRNVVQALGLGAEEVVAVEINGMIPEHMAAVLPAESDPFRDPRVRLVVAEGRETAARMAARITHGEAGFDLVYVPITTLFGTSGQVFTQTYLMTAEALELYLGMLRPGGRVAVFSPNTFRSKVVVAMARALEKRGIERPDEHLSVLATRNRFLVVARPDARLGPEEGRLPSVGAGEPSRLVPAEELATGARLRRLTDDNPFLYNDLWIGADAGKGLYYGWNVAMLRIAFAVATLLLLLGGLATVVRGAPEWRARSSAFAAAFATMGIAYTAYQTVVIQRLAFLVGHPLLATAVVLPCTLLATALGAHWSRRLGADNLARVRVLTTAGLLAFVAGLALVAPSDLILASLPPWTRLLLSVLLAAPPFVVMGTFFPVVFARVELEDPRALAPGWLLNGLGAILGSVLAIYGPMLFGFRVVFGLVALLYLALSAWDVLSRRPARGADLALAAGLGGALLVTFVALELGLAA